MCATASVAASGAAAAAALATMLWESALLRAAAGRAATSGTCKAGGKRRRRRASCAKGPPAVPATRNALQSNPAHARSRWRAAEGGPPAGASLGSHTAHCALTARNAFTLLSCAGFSAA